MMMMYIRSIDTYRLLLDDKWCTNRLRITINHTDRHVYY